MAPVDATASATAPELALASSPAVAAGAAPLNRFGLPHTEPAPAFPPPSAYPPPTGYTAPGNVPVPSARADHEPAEGAMLSRRAVALVAIAIGVGAVGMGVSYLIGRNQHLEPATAIRDALVLTLGVYIIVGALLVTQLVPGIKLRWTNGSPAAGVLIGASVGGVISAILLAVVSAASGHLSPDPRIVTLMSEGDVAHIAVTIAISCLMAPVIEEILFRGLLLESLRGKGLGAALSLSGIAFAVWHLNPAALKYYALMGGLLGFLYVKRGLVCSMAAHFTFNGVLTVAALAVVLSPGKTFTFADMSIHAPSGWGQHHATIPAGLASAFALEGPSESAVVVMEIPESISRSVTVSSIETALNSGAMSTYLPNYGTSLTDVREVRLPVGTAVEADVTVDGHSGNFVFVPRPTETVMVMFLSAGSEKAKADFPHMLDSLRVA